MSANITVYCLEKITDYLQFERLCSDLMSLEGYKTIEPLGGFNDKGRDAIHVENSKNSIFAYSVREDWQIKLSEDAAKVKKHGHSCDDFIFITTASFSANARDQAIQDIKDIYGWNLILYGVERLRILLEVTYPNIRKNHPQIFDPNILQLEENYNRTKEEFVCILYSQADIVFTGWLAQKLLSMGYRVWCNLTNHLFDNIVSKNEDEVIESYSTIVVSVLSNSSIADMEHNRQRAIAIQNNQRHKNIQVIAIYLDNDLPINSLDRDTRKLQFIDFSSNWGNGLNKLTTQFDKYKIEKPIINGKNIAIKVYNENDVIVEQKEIVYLNCFEVIEIPKSIKRYKTNKKFSYVLSNEFKNIWAHRRVNDYSILSFFDPPKEIFNEIDIFPDGGCSSCRTKEIDGIYVNNLISELIRKSINIKCLEKGLRYCNQTNMYYFPDGLISGNRLLYSRPDGTSSWINVVGERKHWTPTKEEYYRYYLSPEFSVSRNLLFDHTILMRVRLRITDTNNNPLSSKKALSRRKHLTNDWWNKEWGDRFFAISNYLADADEIVIGSVKNEKIRISSKPFELLSPTSINETRIDIMKSQDLRFWASFDDNEGEEEVIHE